MQNHITLEILHSEFMDLPFYIMFFAVVFLYGICIGSFLNVVIFRLPNNESLIKRASHCMTCGEKIRIRDLIPVFSWLVLRGKCHSCGEKISGRYPFVESLNALCYITIFAVMDLNLQSILCCFYASILICIGFIDWDTMEMDLRLLGLIPVLGILSTFFTVDTPSLVDRLIGVACVGLPFFLIGEISGMVIMKRTGEKIRGIELGDTILMATSGLLLGWKATVASAMIGIILAAVVGVINKHRSGESKFAFGPFLAIGLFIGMLFGESIVDWYIGTLTYDPYA